MVSKRRKRPSTGGWVLLSLGALLLLPVAGTLYGWNLYRSLCDDPCIDLSPLEAYLPDEGSMLYDRHGVEIGMLYRTNRRVVPLDEIPPLVTGAFLAIEDQRFYEHRGVDWWRVGGAIVANIKARGVSQGFSTITMQLARNVFPDALPYTSRTIERKLMEVRVARDIERRFSKKEILGFYLNSIYLGAGAHGVEAAARTYFGKSAQGLDLAEGALLAGLPQRPSAGNPYHNPAHAAARRNLVLDAMLRLELISTSAAGEARNAEIHLAHGSVDAALDAATNKAPYFIEAVRREMERSFGGALYRGGLRIHTTLDLEVQGISETELESRIQLIEAGELGPYRGPVRDPEAEIQNASRVAYLQGAILVMDPRDGDVLAMVGGRNFAESSFNRTNQALRQPGSAFKPIIYATAFSRGISPRDSVSDGPISIRNPETGEVWTPRNFSETARGVGSFLTVSEALRSSVNRPAVRIALLSGLDSIAAFAKRMGIEREIPPYPSIALGSIDLTMMELLTAYTPIARTDGYRVTPRLVRRVEDRNGRSLLTVAPRTDPALDPGASALLRGVLREAIDQGTGGAVRRVGYQGEAAGKTGTTNGATDTWFLGVTPHRIAAVWMGFDTPAQIMAGTAGTGGNLAAPVWGRVMLRADSLPVSEVRDTLGWRIPEDLRYVADRERTHFQCPVFGSDPFVLTSLPDEGDPEGTEHQGTRVLDRILARLSAAVASEPARPDLLGGIDAHYQCVPARGIWRPMDPGEGI